MIYFDNAATSFPKPRNVLNEVNRCIKYYCGNPGRSSHRLSMMAADKIYETREKITDFIGAKQPENVIFTPNATYGLNLAIKGLIDHKCHCIISDLEHNSVLRPLYKAAKEHGAEYSVYNSDNDLLTELNRLLRDDTEVIISTLCSNVNGKIIDFDVLSSFAKSNNLKLVLDASQYVGHKKISLDNMYYTVLCTAGHKSLFGIQGSAFAIINDENLFDTLTEGGSGIETFSKSMPLLLPERFEAGTPSTPAIVSLGAGIDFINDVGINNVDKHISALTEELSIKLSGIHSVKLYGANNGIASFNVKDYPSSHIASLLNKNAIATRSGFHCSPLIHRKMKTTERGAVRVSLSYFNNIDEIHKLCKLLEKM